jgi:pSer/pThr/pTyr-binding forkhead associated (FHA) protein
MALVTVTSSGAEPRSYELNKPRTVFGRDTNCDVHLDNLSISKNHCEIVNDNGRFIIRDLKSSNKTYVNGKEVQEQQLNNGDEIVVGNFKVTFSGAIPFIDNRPKPPAADEPFEPTLQLPPEMIRKKMEEMQREKEKGVSSARAAAATTATRPQNTPAQQSTQAPAQTSGSGSNMAVMLVVGAIVLVIVVDIIFTLRNH